MAVFNPGHKWLIMVKIRNYRFMNPCSPKSFYGKARGSDNIPPEACKEGVLVSVKISLHSLLNQIWNVEDISQDWPWRLGLLVKL